MAPTTCHGEPFDKLRAGSVEPRHSVLLKHTQIAGAEAFIQSEFPRVIFFNHFEERRFFGFLVLQDNFGLTGFDFPHFPFAFFQNHVRIKHKQKIIPVGFRHDPAAHEIIAQRFVGAFDTGLFGFFANIIDNFRLGLGGKSAPDGRIILMLHKDKEILRNRATKAGPEKS